MRIYVSATKEDLGEHRLRVLDNLRRTGHTVVAMEDYGAQDIRPVHKCLEDVASCDLYVGLFAWRYGYVDDDYPASAGRSITELEYRRAVELGKQCLVFLLDDDAPWPPRFVDRGEAGDKVTSLREELRRSRLVDVFTGPDDLAAKVASMVARAVAETQEAPEQVSLPAERIAGPLPSRVEHFHDRVQPFAHLRQLIGDGRLRLLMVCGRAGIGKTSLITELVHDVVSGAAAETPLRDLPSVVYVSLNQPDYRSPDRIVELICRTLPADQAQLLQAKWREPGSLHDRLEFVFHRILQGRRSLIVLDGLEAVLDQDDDIAEEFADLRTFVDCALEYDHAATLVVSSRRPLVLRPELGGRRGAFCHELGLDEGLPDSEAIALLRALDTDGRLGFRDGPDEQLMAVVRPCLGIPLMLETVVGTMRGWKTRTLSRLLADPSTLVRLTEQPSCELYESRPATEHEVLKALAVLGRPVSADAVQHLLPGTDTEPMLDVLVRDYVVSFQAERQEFSLLPPDQDLPYRLLVQQEDGTRETLHQRAAAYWAAEADRLEQAPALPSTASQLLDHPLHFAAHHGMRV